MKPEAVADEYMTREAVAQLLHRSQDGLRRALARPEFAGLVRAERRIGRRVIYQRRAVVEWIESLCTDRSGAAA